VDHDGWRPEVSKVLADVEREDQLEKVGGHVRARGGSLELDICASLAIVGPGHEHLCQDP
jgi:hypothetical protein